MSFISSELTGGMRCCEGGSSVHLVPPTTTTLSPLEAAVKADWRARLAVREGRSASLNTRQELTCFLWRPAWTDWGSLRVLL